LATRACSVEIFCARSWSFQKPGSLSSCSSLARRCSSAAGSKVITDPVELGPDLFELLLERSLCLGHGLDRTGRGGANARETHLALRPCGRPGVLDSVHGREYVRRVAAASGDLRLPDREVGRAQISDKARGLAVHDAENGGTHD